jgi:hypothetical protein
MFRILYLLHLATVVIGFGSSFVYPMLAVRARKLGPEAARESYAINHAAFEVSKMITTPVIYASGVLGVLLALLGKDEGIEFSQLWISIAFVLFLAAALIAGLLHVPNLKAMDRVEEQLVSGNVKAPASGGPPKQVAELAERGKKAASFGGLLHLFWLLLMIDMIWQPGRLT